MVDSASLKGLEGLGWSWEWYCARRGRTQRLDGNATTWPERGMRFCSWDSGLDKLGEGAVVTRSRRRAGRDRGRSVAAARRAAAAVAVQPGADGRMGRLGWWYFFRGLKKDWRFLGMCGSDSGW